MIECVHIDPVRKTCTICADIFVHNWGPDEDWLEILHRGSLTARDVTTESWGDDVPVGWPATIARRVEILHQAGIERRPGAIKVRGTEYRLWNGPASVVPATLGDAPLVDVPFTMWELGPFPPNEHCIARLALELHAVSYARQIGNSKGFYAYGDAILLDKIEYEDLPTYNGPDGKRFRETFRTFKEHLVPRVFEWLLVSPDGEPLPWVTTTLSANFSPQVIRDDYSATTQWFVAEYAQADTFHVKGELSDSTGAELSNAFALRVEDASAVAAAAA